MLKLHCERLGEGGIPLVMIHGWGLNSAVWHGLVDELGERFSLYLVDLPGFGLSKACSEMSLATMAAQVRDVVPRNACWLGWSLGGLVAQHAALVYADEMCGLVTVASTAQFVEQADWPGVSPKVLASFAAGLDQDYTRTLQQFLAIQALGSEHAKQDIKSLRLLLKQRPLPDLGALRTGLALLAHTDLRNEQDKISLPWLQLFGRQDSLVPKAIIPQLHALNPQALQFCFAKSSHAPFISEKDEFCRVLIEFAESLL